MQSFQPSLIIDTDTTLRQPIKQDVTWLNRLARQEANRLNTWFDWVEPAQSHQGAQQYFAERQEKFNEGRQLFYVIEYHGEPAGAIGVQLSMDDNKGWVSYWLDSQHEGHGIARRSCKCIITYCFKDLGLHRLEMEVSPGNRRSLAIPIGLGFTNEGTRREVYKHSGQYHDLVMFGLLSREWNSRS